MTDVNKPLIHVVGAVIVNEAGLILCARRSAHRSLGGCWEFPGGKVESGETEQIALQREILEEMAIEIEIGERIVSVVYAYEKVNVHSVTYFAHIVSGEITLKDHDQIRWLARYELNQLKWAPADLPTVTQLNNG